MEELMKQPLYRLQIHFEKVNCLGEQLAAVLEQIKLLSGRGVWYACDVDTTCDNLKIQCFMNYFPRRVGTIDDMIHLANSIDQFLSGVFLLLTSDFGKQLNSEYSTEDEQFRDVKDAILEIRAFDTTWLLLFSKNRNFIYEINKHFNGDISVGEV